MTRKEIPTKPPHLREGATVVESIDELRRFVPSSVKARFAVPELDLGPEVYRCSFYEEAFGIWAEHDDELGPSCFLLFTRDVHPGDPSGHWREAMRVYWCDESLSFWPRDEVCVWGPALFDVLAKHFSAWRKHFAVDEERMPTDENGGHVQGPVVAGWLDEVRKRNASRPRRRPR